MSEARLRDQLKRLRAADGPAPSFESTVAPRRRRGRLRLARAAFAGASLLLALVVVLVAKPDPPPRLAALALPPTTDWLLKTPRVDGMITVPKKERRRAT